MRGVWTASLLWVLALAATGAELRVEPERTQVTMGRNLDVTVTYRGDADPGFIGYHAWRDNFLTERLDRRADTVDGQTRVGESLRLFPRRSGRLTLHALRHGGALSRPVAVTVRPLRLDGVDGTPRWRHLPASVWSREAFTVAVAVPKLHPRNEVNAAPLTHPAFTVERLPDQQKRAEGHAVVVLRWRLRGRRHGLWRIDLPAIVQRGRGRWRFHLPVRDLEVTPLPSYLPETVPVGGLGLSSELVEVDEGPAWQVTVTGSGSLPQEVYGLRKALAVIGGMAPEAVTVVSATGSTAAAAPARQVYRVHVPPWSWGWGHGPAVTVPYFDPDRGVLRERHHRLPAARRLPEAARYLLATLGAGLAMAGVIAGYRLAAVLRRHRRFRRAAREAADPHTLRRLLLAESGHRTLADWSLASGGGAAANIADRLNRLCYSREAGPLPQGMGMAAARHAPGAFPRPRP